MENPIKMDDLGVPLFSETPICLGWFGKKMFLPNGGGDESHGRKWTNHLKQTQAFARFVLEDPNHVLTFFGCFAVKENHSYIKE